MITPIHYIPHGGGPMPLFGEPNHAVLIKHLKSLRCEFRQPKAILVISAHWEETQATVTSATLPQLIFDYYGFPEETYQISYPVPGSPALAGQIVDLLLAAGIEAKADPKRGLDHGSFVPLKLIYPNADIPVIQLSLTRDLDPTTHIRIGEAIADIARQGVAILGSGLSFHNMQVLMSKEPTVMQKSIAFDQWLNQTVVDRGPNWQQREMDLINWSNAPHARFAHPREEHLLPLHVCFGAAKKLNLSAENNFHESLLGARISGYIWR